MRENVKNAAAKYEDERAEYKIKSRPTTTVMCILL